MKSSKSSCLKPVGGATFWLCALLVCLVAALATTASPASGTSGYGDVPDGEYFTDAVQWSVDNNITGITGRCFSPKSPMSRGETAGYIWNMEGRPTAPAHSFIDITVEAQHDPVSWMSHNEITTGTSPTTFSPDTTLTRAQLAAFLHRLAGKPSAPAHSFIDVVVGWQHDPVSWMSHNEITTGTSPTTFSPDTTLTRAELVTFLYRYKGEPAVTIHASTPLCDPSAEPVSAEPDAAEDDDTDEPDAAEDDDTDNTDRVLAPPAALGFDPFYEKYLDAGGLPILSSARVADEALLQAKRLIEEILTNRPDILTTLAANNIRVAIMAEGSGITELPELSDLYEVFPGIDWDNRTRGGGVGPTHARPVLAIAEENILCSSTDRFPHEDIVVHEVAHAVLNIGIESQPTGYAVRQRLERAYSAALDTGLWQSTYAAENSDEYWAEGVQSWFDLNDPPGPIHNEINTRSELEEYDPALAALVKDTFGEVTLSSCHSAATHPQHTSRILGVLLGPNGTAVEGVVLWAWSGEASSSGVARFLADGRFAIVVPDGSFTLDIHANSGEACTFVGWHGPDGFTTMRESATLFVVDGASISGIEINLPRQLGDLPFIEWCS